MKKILRALSAIIVAIVLAVSCMVMSVSAENAVESAEQSVVLVAAGGGWGSGFAIGNAGEDPQYIVTNCHVITDDDGNVHDDLTVFFSAAANKFVSAEVIAADTSKDLCVLELPEPTSERKPLTLCKSENVSKGDEVYILGYPGYSLAGKNYTTFDTKDMTSAKGSISQKTRINNSGAIGTNVFMTDTLIDSGNSGGPMINTKGEAIGIAAWEIVEEDEEGNDITRTTGGYATIVDELIPLLDANNIPYTLSTEVSDNSSEDNNNSTEEDDGQTAQVTQQTDPVNDDNTNKPANEDKPDKPKPEEKSGNTLMIVIIAAAAVAVVIVAVVIIISKKKKSSGNNQTVSGQASGRGAVIAGVKGIMAGRQFPINGSIIIGRNSQKCNVCFPVDTKGVSGTHCQIRKVSVGYEIVDLGSSNGTFLGSGQRLTPDVPVVIPDGTYFYLGSTEQLFQIKY